MGRLIFCRWDIGIIGAIGIIGNIEKELQANTYNSYNTYNTYNYILTSEEGLCLNLRICWKRSNAANRVESRSAMGIEYHTPSAAI